MTTDARTQTERVVLTLREMLLRGDFKPGERLAELSLVALLGASRTPVRLALDRLAHEGLLEAKETTGFRVRAFALDDVWDA
ncbi:MAG TPA: winged helix-turn-helix domain-containing protein, partial [Polyangiaceae bacterium]|nr:winged helix-turn-helix domain-containing protein [Polyangiaceae bacterium]